MNARKNLLLLLFMVSQYALAQKGAVHANYEWEKTPAIHKVAPAMLEYPAVCILQNKFMELRVEGEARSYITEHKIIHINSDAGIEKFNKVYISMQGEKELISIRVRSISPEGKITELRKENLKELKNVEGYGNFKIFAVEGLAVNGEMEYIYTTQGSPQMYGREVFQGDIPVLSANFEIICPDNFTYQAKTYNGLNSTVPTTFDQTRKTLATRAANIPALADEEYSANKTNRMRVDYKIESNGRATDMVSWKSISKRFVENTYEPSAAAKVKRFLAPLKLNELSELEKIRAVERFIKTNFTIQESGNDAYEDVKKVIENHVGSERGMVKLYVSCWEVLDLSPQLVFCTNRFSGALDSNFPAPQDISDVIFYFPRLEQYLTPGVAYKRLGAAPENIASGQGLFIDYGIVDGEIYYSSHSFKVIEPLDYTRNNQGVKAIVRFKDGLDSPEVTQENSWQGYRGSLYRGIYFYRDGPRKEEFIKDVTLSGIDGVNLIKREIQGENLDLSFDPENYFIVKTQYAAASLMEKAGDDYLLAIGKIIGKQSELYQEKQRQTPIEFSSISNYNHEIVIEIPAGYTCTGLEAIKINNLLNDGNEAVMGFRSDYTLEANRLTIRVNEFYKILKVAKDQYEPFRTVINSAADFNKLVLVLHKAS